jgi:hypothetical protein
MLNLRRDVMAGLTAAIHAFRPYPPRARGKTWMPATRRGHGNGEVLQPHRNALKSPQSAGAQGDQMVPTCPATYPT